MLKIKPILIKALNFTQVFLEDRLIAWRDAPLEALFFLVVGFVIGAILC